MSVAFIKVADAQAPLTDFTLGLYADQPKDFVIPHIYVNGDVAFIKGTDFGFRSVAGAYYVSSTSNDLGFSASSTVSSTSLGVGGLYYFNRLLKLDKENIRVYGGVVIAYTSVHSSISSSSAYVQNSSGTAGKFDFVFTAGGKYFFSKRFGANAEFDFRSNAAFKAGLCYRLLLK